VILKKIAQAQALHVQQMHSIPQQLSVHMEVMQLLMEHARQTVQTRTALAQLQHVQEATGRNTSMHQAMEMYGGVAHGKLHHALCIALLHRP
jgi:hypothetical protein